MHIITKKKRKFLLSDSLCSNHRGLCLFQPRSDRVPLRDVQNELMNLQDSPTLMLKHASMHERDPKTRYGDIPSLLSDRAGRYISCASRQ